MAKILKTLRNNWKKSTFGACVLSYGIHLASDKIKAGNVLRAYCEQARQYGEVPILNTVKPRHVTVILNPTAKDKKGKKLYESYCEPLLHLAGIRVSTVLTEDEGQARDLMEIMDNTDAVIIAGGDGTLHEAVTGLLRRNDQDFATKKIPIGIAPIGKTNSLAKKLFWKEDMTEAQFLAEATMAVIYELTKSIDVVKIQGSQNKPVFAVANFECGTFRDVDSLIPNYWYFGFLKQKVTYLFGAMKNQIKNLDLNLSYTLPCEGCSKCFVLPEEKPVVSQSNAKWWNAFVPKVPKAEIKQETVDYSKIINEQCGQWFDEKIQCSNVLMTILNENEAIRAIFHKPDINLTKFVSEGWARHSKSANEPKEDNDAILKTLSFSKVKLEPNIKENEELWYNIDNENYEAQNIEISLLKRKITIYAA